MPRGRKRLPDAVVALKGERRHHRQPEPAPAWFTDTDARRVVLAEIPDFLTGDRERAIFRKTVEDYLQRRIARAPDFVGFGRWAHYLDAWIRAKEHDEIDLQMELERVIRPLEDRLGLSPVARQEILRGLAAVPGAVADVLAGRESGDAPPEGEAGGVPRTAGQPSTAVMPAASPLGWLKPRLVK